jgi:hypothetical protein
MSDSEMPFSRPPGSSSALATTGFLSIFIFIGVSLLLPARTSALAQERLSASAVEELVRDVHPKRVVELIKQFGINFELTDELRSRLRKAGAGSDVMQALELAVIRNRLAQGGEKAKSEEATKEPPSPASGQTAESKRDSARDRDGVKNTEPARGLETKRNSSDVGDERARSAESPKTFEPKPVTLPSQLQEKADHALRVENVSIKDGEVAGELLNISQQTVFGVQFQVLYSWRWNNDFRPGGQDPGRAEYFTIDREIRPGQRVPFNHKPTPPLPARTDGTFDISVKVIGFTKIFREGS